MINNIKKLERFLVDFTATYAYIGHLPVFPGTWGSIFTLPIVFYFVQKGFLSSYIFMIISLAIWGVWASTKYDFFYKTKDASQIVIDEVVGQMIALLPLFFYRQEWYFYLIGFILFRFFDISKVLGVDLLQKLSKGWGVMMDDILAGVYSGLIMWVILWQVR